jgi:hypothetical protein
VKSHFSSGPENILTINHSLSMEKDGNKVLGIKATAPAMLLDNLVSILKQELHLSNVQLSVAAEDEAEVTAQVATGPSLPNFPDWIRDARRDSAGLKDGTMLGSLKAVCHFITHHTILIVYGGFIRDYLAREESHGQMDLDVGYGLPKQGCSEICSQEKAREEWARVADWIGQNNICRIAKNAPKGPNVHCYTLMAPDSGTFDVELVDIKYFKDKNGPPDADVNGFALDSNGELCWKMDNLSELCGSLRSVWSRCCRKHMKVINVTTFDDNRREKFSSRGWSLTG